ncbi:GmrSD restriction endonuclease domain-containing protein [Hymenobacter ruber]
MNLQQQIDKARKEIKTDGYSMSIGEWISIYESEEIDIHPEFQRFFRWSASQKTRLIESILLGIPIPQVFVAQRPDGVWDVVDGLQRLSTIYQLVGMLKKTNGELESPLVLQGTKYLPGLEGKKWEDDDDDKSLTPAQRLIIKRTKITVSIILRESNETSKYELFQRLNTGGSSLSAQEVRNSIAVMMNIGFYEWLRKLANNDDFKACTSLSDRAVDEQYDMDLALRFVIFRTINQTDLKKVGDVNDFLTNKMIELLETKAIDMKKEKEAFDKTFKLLRDRIGEECLRKYDNNKQKFTGGFLLSAFEAVALGVGYNYSVLEKTKGDLMPIVAGIWSNKVFVANSGSGVRASSRIPSIIPLGRQMFVPKILVKK